jgi:hypothetical protein
MGPAPTLLLLVLWLALAYRALQRGDLLLAAILVAVAVALIRYRLRRLRRPLTPGNPDGPYPTPGARRPSAVAVRRQVRALQVLVVPSASTE